MRAAVSNPMLNMTSVINTSSNHTLQSFMISGSHWSAQFYKGKYSEVRDSIMYSMNVNLNDDKAEVAREKILDHHLSDEHANKSVFAGMSEPVLPHAIEWVGQDNDGLSAMYNLVRCLPTLFDVNNKMSCEE